MRNAGGEARPPGQLRRDRHRPRVLTCLVRPHIQPHRLTLPLVHALRRPPPSRFELDDGHPVLYVYELQVDRHAQVSTLPSL